MVNYVNAQARLFVLLSILAGSFLLAFAQAKHPLKIKHLLQPQELTQPWLQRQRRRRTVDDPGGQGYAAGSGVDQDDTIAADWYRKAAVLGNLEAQLRLADCYRDGRGVPRDMAQAAEWYRKAAEQGDLAAQATLGLLYSMGQGVSRDDVEPFSGSTSPLPRPAPTRIAM